MQKLRVGVVGVGYLGQYHAQKYAQLAEVELVGVADVDIQRAREVARQYNTVAFEDHRQLLDRLDAVSIVVPTPLHHRLGLDFLENQVDVLIEKPMTTTLNQADELIAVAEKSNLIIQVGHLERFNPAVLALEGDLGEPLLIEAHRLSTPKGRGTDVSVVLDLMIHDIDIILHCVPADIAALEATGFTVTSSDPRLVDVANARLEFANGCVANITASRVAVEDQRQIVFYQRDATLSVDFANRQIARARSGGSHAGAPSEVLRIDQQQFDQGDALESEIRAFVHAVQRRGACPVPGQAGRQALAVALDIMDQIEAAGQKP